MESVEGEGGGHEVKKSTSWHGLEHAAPKWTIYGGWVRWPSWRAAAEGRGGVSTLVLMPRMRLRRQLVEGILPRCRGLSPPRVCAVRTQRPGRNEGKCGRGAAAEWLSRAPAR
jgi:hypothetical protein